jgi:hypothetical protein
MQAKKNPSNQSGSSKQLDPVRFWNGDWSGKISLHEQILFFIALFIEKMT